MSQGLAAVPDTEYDEEGRILGLGLTLRPTPHRYTVAGEHLYTWCALDTLVFPALIGKAATIESTSPGSGTPVKVTTGADGTVTSVQPATAVVSLVNPGGTGPVRSSFCNQVHYFASREEARTWLETHPGGGSPGYRSSTPGRRRHRSCHALGDDRRGSGRGHTARLLRTLTAGRPAVSAVPGMTARELTGRQTFDPGIPADPREQLHPCTHPVLQQPRFNQMEQH